jgi:hypothetical protein
MNVLTEPDGVPATLVTVCYLPGLGGRLGGKIQSVRFVYYLEGP